MRMWIDTEFNGFGGELISMALAAESGLCFYAVLHCDSPCEWVAENVIPVLHEESISKERFQEDLSMFLNMWEDVHIVADWPEDVAHFCNALITAPGYAIDTPKMTFEIRRDIDVESPTPHNALADAIAIREKHLEMENEQ